MKQLLTIIIFYCLGLYAEGQISLSPDSISLGDTNSSWIQINNYQKLIWNTDKNNYLKIDVSKGEHTSMSGSNDCINFYDTDRCEYLQIFVEGSNIMSDSCTKSNIEPIETDFIQDIRPVSFRWKYDKSLTRSSASSVSNDTSDIHYGFIAQELMDVYPEIVRQDDYGNYMVNYNALIPLVIKALQDIEIQINNQAKELEDLITEANLLMNTTITNP